MLLNVTTGNPKALVPKDVTSEEDLIFPEDIRFVVLDLRVWHPRSRVEFMGMVALVLGRHS